MIAWLSFICSPYFTCCRASFQESGTLWAEEHKGCRGNACHVRSLLQLSALDHAGIRSGIAYLGLRDSGSVFSSGFHESAASGHTLSRPRRWPTFCPFLANEGKRRSGLPGEDVRVCCWCGSGCVKHKAWHNQDSAEKKLLPQNEYSVIYLTSCRTKSRCCYFLKEPKTGSFATFAMQWYFLGTANVEKSVF